MSSISASIKKLKWESSHREEKPHALQNDQSTSQPIHQHPQTNLPSPTKLIYQAQLKFRDNSKIIARLGLENISPIIEIEIKNEANSQMGIVWDK